MHWHRMPGVLAVAVALLACQDRTASRLTAPTIDTLPGGALRIRNHAPTEWPDTLTWSFVEDLRIGGNDTASPLEHPSGVAVDALGRIYVSDGTVKMFDQDGRLVRTVGRDGNGDGRADPDNIYDAALGAAVYLCRSGDLSAEPALRGAYLTYNRSLVYVDTVIGFATAYRDAVALPSPAAR